MGGKRVFTDPKTGEEIESTALARWVAGLCYGLVVGLVLGYMCLAAGAYVLVDALGGHEHPVSPSPWLVPSALFLIGVLAGLHLAWRGIVSGGVRDPIFQAPHDAIARWQHRRRR